MKSRKLLFSTLLATTVVWAGCGMAQEANPAPSGSMVAQPTPMPQQTATTSTPQGQVTVISQPAPAPVIGTPPSFEQLSGGGKSISEDQAAAFPPLANDFINADHDRNGKINKSEYTRWLKQLK